MAHLTFSQMASPILLAMLERHGTMRPLFGWMGLREAVFIFAPWFSVMLLSSLTLALVEFMGYLYPPEWIPALYGPAVLPVLTAVYADSKLRTRHAIADGRAMLERLGW